MNKEREHIPRQSEISSQYLDLWERHDEHPLEPRLWDEVSDLVEREEGSPLSMRGPYSDIPADELIRLADRVRAENDPLKKYEIVASKGPNDEIWFDILKGFSSDEIAEGVADVLSRRHWQNGLDLGTGTGRLADKVRPYCNQLVGLDRVKPMLEANEATLAVQADAAKLPFADNSFDLVMSMGLAGSLDTEQSKKFYQEISRVLEPNGLYIDAFYYSGDDELHSEIREVLVNAKGILADMIVDQVSGKAELESANYGEIVATLAEENLQIEYHHDKKRSIAYGVIRKS